MFEIFKRFLTPADSVTTKKITYDKSREISSMGTLVGQTKSNGMMGSDDSVKVYSYKGKLFLFTYCAGSWASTEEVDQETANRHLH